MSDIFEEVEESIRQDRVSLWWAKYGIIVWLIGFVMIGAVTYMEWNKGQLAKATEARILVFENAREKLAAGDYTQAQAAFKELVDGKTDISPLAAQFLAKAYYEGNGDAALAAETLQASATLEGPVERLALLKAAYLQTNTMSLADLEALLGDLPSESTALGALALELIAAKAFKEGDFARARKEFGYLRFAPSAPQGVIQRAEVALSVIPVPENVSEIAEPVKELTEIEALPANQDNQEGGQ